MREQQHYNITPLGDAALLVQFGNAIDAAINKKVRQLFQKLKALQWPYIIDVIPAYASLGVYYDVYQLLQQERPKSAFDYVSGQIQKIINETTWEEVQGCNTVQIPVCYAPVYAPDIEAVAQQKNIPVQEVVNLHTARTYTVYMIGFLPGFAYMGEVDNRIAVTRRQQPRLRIEAGSVGIAGKQTGIYPCASPGGWQIIGRTPLLLFCKEAEQPALLQPSDEVRFYSITEDEFTNY